MLYVTFSSNGNLRVQLGHIAQGIIAQRHVELNPLLSMVPGGLSLWPILLHVLLHVLPIESICLSATWKADVCIKNEMDMNTRA